MLRSRSQHAIFNHEILDMSGQHGYLHDTVWWFTPEHMRSSSY
jgi:hypothetical protein